MKTCTSLLSLVILAGCATKPVPLTASVEIPVPCVAKKPARPVLITEAELAALGDYDAVLALEVFRLRATGYIGELEAVVDGCSKIPQR